MRRPHMIAESVLRGIMILLFPLVQSHCSHSQPYVDLFQIRITAGMRSTNSPATPFMHSWAGSDLPIKLRPNTYLLLSPFFEGWDIDSAKTRHIVPALRSITLPVGLILPLHRKWTLNLMPVARSNGEQLFRQNTFQFGIVSFVSYAVTPQKKIRLGLYTNMEFFGQFTWPLLGADWRFGPRDYLFALLPGRLTYEHRWNKILYSGLTFRALTNSYRLQDGSYIRVDDNQLSADLSAYLAKRWCIMLEPGYGISRRLRQGTVPHVYSMVKKMGDGFFFKVSTSYRIRF